MICPHCSASINYKERSYLICDKCKKEFAFEPKRHPLLLSDAHFTKIVGKLSDGGNTFFTKEQLQFALSRKIMKSSSAVLWLLIPAGITSLIAFFVVGGISDSSVAGGYAAAGLFLIWLFLIVFLKIKRTKNIALPQTPEDFEFTVIHRWREIYRKYPDMLILEARPDSVANEKTRGILLCETQDAANCLIANKINTKLDLAILTETHAKLFGNRPDLPVFVLHNASIEGCNFVLNIRNQFATGRRIIDIGLRPQTAIKSNLPLLRKRSKEKINSRSLSSEESKWLSDGFYTPLFTLRPAQLIKHVTNHTEPKPNSNASARIEKEAKAIGFMTWIGEK